MEVRYLLLVVTGKLLSVWDSQQLNTEHLLQTPLHLIMRKEICKSIHVGRLRIQDKIYVRRIYLGCLIKYCISTPSKGTVSLLENVQQ